MKFSIIALIAIISIVLIAGCTQQQPNPEPNGSVNNGNLGPKETVEVSITANGFEPSTISINAGDTIKFTNNDSSPHWPASNPHPVHSDLAGFDAKKELQQGESYSFTFTKTGTFGFHDHLNPSNGGTITING